MCAVVGTAGKKEKKKFQNELFSLLPLLHIWVSVMKHRRWRRRSRVNTHTRTSGGPFSPISAGWVERERTLKSRARSSGRSQRLFLELDVWWCSSRVFQERLETFFFFLFYLLLLFPFLFLDCKTFNTSSFLNPYFFFIFCSPGLKNLGQRRKQSGEKKRESSSSPPRD